MSDTFCKIGNVHFKCRYQFVFVPIFVNTTTHLDKYLGIACQGVYKFITLHVCGDSSLKKFTLIHFMSWL